MSHKDNGAMTHDPSACLCEAEAASLRRRQVAVPAFLPQTAKSLGRRHLPSKAGEELMTG
jgi:hypothetical protein